MFKVDDWQWKDLERAGLVKRNNIDNRGPEDVTAFDS